MKNHSYYRHKEMPIAADYIRYQTFYIDKISNIDVQISDYIRAVLCQK